MGTMVTTASPSVATGGRTERTGVERFGGIAAIIAAIIVISPVVVFGVVMPAFGLSTREAYANPAVIQAKWPLLMVESPLVLSLGFAIVLVTLALHELMAEARAYRNVMRLSLGLAF